MRWRKDSIGVVEEKLGGARVVGQNPVLTMALAVAGLRGGCRVGRCEALGGLPGDGGGGRFPGVMLSSRSEFLPLGARTMAVLSLARPPSPYLLSLGVEEEGHFGTEEDRGSSFPPFKNPSSSSSSSAETDC